MTKLYSLCILTAALSVSPALAQGNPQANPQGQGQPRARSQAYRVSVLRMDARLESRLKITPEQRAKIEEIVKKSRTATATPPELPAAQQDRLKAFNKAKETQQKAEADAEAVLTTEQKKQLDQIRKDVDQYPGLGRIGLGLAFLPDITEAQRGKLRQISAQAIQRRGQLVAGFRQQGQNANTAELRQKLRELDTQIGQSVQATLTPDQIAALKGSPRRRPTTAGQ